MIICILNWNLFLVLSCLLIVVWIWSLEMWIWNCISLRLQQLWKSLLLRLLNHLNWQSLRLNSSYGVMCLKPWLTSGTVFENIKITLDLLAPFLIILVYHFTCFSSSTFQRIMAILKINFTRNPYWLCILNFLSTPLTLPKSSILFQVLSLYGPLKLLFS